MVTPFKGWKNKVVGTIGLIFKGGEMVEFDVVIGNSSLPEENEGTSG